MTPAELAARQKAQEDLFRNAKPVGAPALLAGAAVANRTPMEPDETDAEATIDFDRAATKQATRKADLVTMFHADGPESKEAEAAAEQAEEAHLAELERQRVATPVTIGGDRAPSAYPAAAKALVDAGTGAAGWLYDHTVGLVAPVVEAGKEAISTQAAIAGALIPQSLDTPYQAEQREIASKNNATRREIAAQQITGRLDYLREKGAVTEAEAAKLAEDARKSERFAGGLSTMRDGSTSARPDTFGRSAEQAAIVARFPELGPLIDGYNKTESVAATEMQTAAAASAIESPASYILRMLGAPPSAAAGVIEAAATDRTIGETVPERLRGGEGFTGLGVDAGGAAGKMVDDALPPMLASRLNMERTGKIAGGAVGFLADLAVPVDLGVGDFVTGGRVLSEAAQAVPRELRPSMLEEAISSVIPGMAPANARERAINEIRNRVGGIPETHAMGTRSIAIVTLRR